MSAISLALGRERARERDVSWEPKSFSVAWSAEPFYDTERIMEKQGVRLLTDPTLNSLESSKIANELPDYPNWLIKGFIAGAIIFFVGLAGVATSVFVRRTPLADGAIAVMAVGMIVLAFSILKGREITDRSS